VFLYRCVLCSCIGVCFVLVCAVLCYRCAVYDVDGVGVVCACIVSIMCRAGV